PLVYINSRSSHIHRHHLTLPISYPFFFLTAPPPTETYPLSLHDALPICPTTSPNTPELISQDSQMPKPVASMRMCPMRPARAHPDRKSTRLNSSHVSISYAVFCLKKKK